MNIAQKIVVNYLSARLNITAVFSPAKAAASAYTIFSTPFRKSRKPAPQIFGQCERLFLNTANGKMNVYRWNHPAPKKILILHGFESRAYHFDAYVKPLIRLGFEVVALDAPAHGGSEGKRLSLPDYVAAITSVSDTYGPFQAFLGHSFGGLALGMFLEAKPEMGKSNAILIAPATETTTAINSFFRFLQLGLTIRRAFDDHIRQLSGRDPEYYSLKRIVPALQSHRFLWIHDEDDELTPLSDVKPLIEQRPSHVKFIITKTLGHRRIYRDSHVRQQIIAFLSEKEVDGVIQDSTPIPSGVVR
jgi:pimeloyl-ACP methyl ester carboxylesterase